MNVKLQLITFLCSFVFGVIFGFLSIVQFKFCQNKKKIFQYLTTIIFVIDMVLLYILMMYKINKGIFHIYFLSFILLGFILSLYLHKHVKQKVKERKKTFKKGRQVL